MALNEENHPFEYSRPSFNMNSEFNPSTTLTNFDFGSGANIALSMPPAPKSPSKDMAQPQESINPIEKPQKSEAGPSSSDLGSIQPPQPIHEAAPQQSFISHGQDGTTFSFPPASTSGQNLSLWVGHPAPCLTPPHNPTARITDSLTTLWTPLSQIITFFTTSQD